MAKFAARVHSRLRVAVALGYALGTYWLVIFPRARYELRRWKEHAASIPDPVLRELALHKLGTEHLTAEGAAAFGILAAITQRRHVVRLCVAFEVMYDFLDALAEQLVPDVLANNHALYNALIAALTPGALPADLYAHHPRQDDGGYLQALIETCQRSLMQMCSHRTVLEALHRLAATAREAQSLHHAVRQRGSAGLRNWAAARTHPGIDVCWWETAAAAGSPLGVFALAAAATRRTMTSERAHHIEHAYFPWIAALSWLLESFVDRDHDARTDEHSYVAHYPSPHVATERLGVIARRAATDARDLPQGALHLVLLAGMVSMNLSHRGAQDAAGRDAAEAVRVAIGGPVRLLLAVLHMRRRIAHQPRRLAGGASARD